MINLKTSILLLVVAVTFVQVTSGNVFDLQIGNFRDIAKQEETIEQALLDFQNQPRRIPIVQEEEVVASVLTPSKSKTVKASLKTLPDGHQVFEEKEYDDPMRGQERRVNFGRSQIGNFLNKLFSVQALDSNENYDDQDDISSQQQLYPTDSSSSQETYQQNPSVIFEDVEIRDPEVQKNLIKLENAVLNKEKKFQNALHPSSESDEMSQELRPVDSKLFETLIDNSYIYIELDQEVKKYDAEKLIDYISSFTHIPSEYFQEFSIKNNLILIKISSETNLNTTDIVNSILKHQYKIKTDTGFNIVACGLGKEEKHRLEFLDISRRSKILEQFNSETSSDKFLVATIIVCASVLCILISLLAIFVIRRKVSLNNDLLGGLRKNQYDDEETLVKDIAQQQQTPSTPWFLRPFSTIKSSYGSKRAATAAATADNLKETPNNQNYKDLCRHRMQSKVKQSSTSIASTSPFNLSQANTTISHINDQTPGLNMGSTTINSTPIINNRVTSIGSNNGAEQKSDSNRSSTSS